MRKLILLNFFLLFICQTFSAQKNMVGSYHISSGNPDDGGYTWLLMENNEFAMVTFGQMVAGTWKETAKNQIQFTPYAAKESFQVFARQNAEIKGTKFMFLGLDINEDSWIGTSGNEIQPILNDDANCLDQIIEKKIDEKITQLILSSCNLETDCQDLKSLQFEIVDNNEFLVLYFNSQNTIAPFTGTITNDQLLLEYGQTSSKKRKISKENDFEVKRYMQEVKNQYNKNQILIDLDNKMVNLDASVGSYDSNPGIQGLSSADYNIDLKSGTYSAKEKFTQDFLVNYNTLFLYKKLESKMQQKSFKKVKNSFLQYSCN